MKKKASILIFVILILGLIGFGIGIFISIPDATDLNEQRIHIPRNIHLENESTVEIIIPLIVVNASSQDSNEVLDEIKENFSQEDVYVNADGSITEILAKEQLEQRIKLFESRLNNIHDKHKNVKIAINENIDGAVYYVTKNCSFLEWAKASMSTRLNLICAQIYSGVLYNEWHLDDKVIYEDGNIVMFEFHLEEGGSWDISSSEWDTKMQELSKQ